MSRRKVLLLIFALAVLLRVWHLDLPFLEPYNSISRQSMCASVVRNFYRNGFNLFYPEIDEGAGPYLYNVEMPVYSYLMAIGYKLAGGVKEWAARSVSAGFSLSLIAFLYLLTRRALGGKAGLWAAGFAAFSPMTLALSRSIQPDITMVAAGAGAVYFFWKWTDGDKASDYALSCALMTFAVATKIFSLYLFLPLLVLGVRKRGRVFAWSPAAVLYGAVVSTALLWYVYMVYMGKVERLNYSPYTYFPPDVTGSFRYLQLFTPERLVLPIKILLMHLLTPAAALLFIFGLWRRKDEAPGEGEVLFYAWLAAAGIYLLIMWGTAVSHPYYQLPLVPPLAFFVARGAVRVRWNAFLAVIMIVITAATCVYFYRGLYFIPAETMAVKTSGERASRILPKDALLVASYGGSPALLYYADRKGWAFSMTGADQEGMTRRLEELRAQGATHFMTPLDGRLNELTSFRKHLDAYRKITEEPGLIIYELKPRSPA